MEEAVLAGAGDDGDAVIEERPAGEEPDGMTLRELHQRVRQQELLAELGVAALKGTPFPELLDFTARLAADGLRADFSKVMEHLPAENRLVIRAGIGWPPGIVGETRVGADLASPAGFALKTGKPVISNHLENEERFRTPELLVEHGIRRAMNVILQGDGTAFGVLEVDSRDEGEFGEHDIAFLQGAANLLGMAIERQRIEGSLRAAVEQREILMQELDHRVSNSLQLVMSMLHLQAGTAEDTNVRRHLQDASNRIAAIARAHRRLQPRGDAGMIELPGYLAEVCADLEAALGACTFVARLTEPAAEPSSRAVSIAIILTELVTNAAKHGYPEGTSGPIRVGLEPDGLGSLRLSVADQGSGVPPGFSPEKSRGLGMRIALVLAQQLGGRIEVGGTQGAEFVLVLPPSRPVPTS